MGTRLAIYVLAMTVNLFCGRLTQCTHPSQRSVSQCHLALSDQVSPACKDQVSVEITKCFTSKNNLAIVN